MKATLNSMMGQSRQVDAGASRHAQAWLLLVGVLAIHVLDEAVTDFLGFYNPLVLTIRSRVPLAFRERKAQDQVSSPPASVASAGRHGDKFLAVHHVRRGRRKHA